MIHSAPTMMPEPERIKKLMHYKGLPVTATTFIEDGIPNFKMIDPQAVQECKTKGLCAICGDPLDYWIAFMVTPSEAESREIYESPQHEECLRYAFQLCPWLYWSKARYSDINPLEGIGSHPDRAVSNERPPTLGIYICRTYKTEHKRKGKYVYRFCKAEKPKRIEWIEGN